MNGPSKTVRTRIPQQPLQRLNEMLTDLYKVQQSLDDFQALVPDGRFTRAMARETLKAMIRMVRTEIRRLEAERS